MRKIGTIAALTLSAALMSAPAFALSPLPNPSPVPQERGQRGSNYNIAQVEQHLDHIMDQLGHDQRDYGGHKAKAMQLLRQAQEQLNRAEQYAAAHGR